MDDSLKFRERLQACVDKFGSIYGLAKKAGLTQNTIRRYFAGSEPTRPKLIAIAKGAGVSIQWLTTGEGEKSPDSSSSDYPTEFWPVGFVGRLEILVQRFGGLERFCDTHRISQSLLKAVLERHIYCPEILIELALEPTIPLNWLLVGQDDRQEGSKALLNNSITRDFLAQLCSVDDFRLLCGDLELLHRFQVSNGIWGWRKTVFQYFVELYKKTPPADYLLLTFQGHIRSDDIRSGDVVLIDKLSTPAHTGLYAFRVAPNESAQIVFLQVSRVGGVLRRAEENGESIQLDESIYECIGRVLIFTRICAK